MTKDLIYVQYPTTDSTQSVASVGITKTIVDPDNGISVKGAFTNKNNTLMICIENAGSASSVTFRAGDAYPNAMLGDLEQPLAAEVATVFQVQDVSRFENKDGSLELDFPAQFEGKIFAVAKSTALNV